MENKLQVRDLTISFRTANGRVQAVRGINFDLARGETLSIVGESGSGKSVTSKAILGILAGNSIVENGEIIYDGKDLLKISEADFHKIRGDKIAMIFQDPMSSLDPIVKIGRQLTEAMILKGKARQRESRKNFNTYLKNLKLAMIDAAAEGKKEKSDAIAEKCDHFNKFEYKHLELEAAYRKAYEAASEAVEEIEALAFELGKNSSKDAAFRVKQIADLAELSVQEYVVKDRAGELKTLTAKLREDAKVVKRPGQDFTGAVSRLRELQKILKEAVSFPEPNFFAMGYYITFSGEPLPKLEVEELNKYLRDYLDEHFMLDFISDTKKALEYSASLSYQRKEEALAALREYLPVFQKESLEKEECYHAEKILSEKVSATINKLRLVKDDLTYTFTSGLKGDLDKYFASIKKNEQEEKKYAKLKKKHDKLLARGKEPDWKLAEPQIVELRLVQKNICRQVERLIDHYEKSLSEKDSRNYGEETIASIDYLKSNASGIVNKVTKQSAKAKALRLMNEVGIAEPRKRFNQYPFEFSGGMRQRIVIAIALAADPDILICDEPTTALDVTIQAQILELINKLKKERHLSVIFITHDLGVVANIADRIAVMYAGKIMEYGTAEDIFYGAAHPYTWALLSSMPDLDTNEKLEAIPGTPPNMIYPPVGDAFAARNKYAMKIDFEKQPPMFKISDTHYAATWLLHPDAPKVDPPKIVSDRIARMLRKREEEDAE